ncbi:MAG: hypothetical protein EBR73_16245 [Rhodobacteraceae bacterium]|jgi:hypothetical protein|nr:hypothetical protein [Paracoccaceae bacterium]
MTPALHARLTELLAQEPRPTAAELRRKLRDEGHDVSPTTAHRWRRNGIPPRCELPDVEATRDVIRARAKELGLLESDGLTLRHGAFVAIAKQATKEGRGITRVAIRWAWEHGIVADDWKLLAPFAVNPAGAKESEKKDTAPPCNP